MECESRVALTATKEAKEEKEEEEKKEVDEKSVGGTAPRKLSGRICGKGSALKGRKRGEEGGWRREG